MVCWEYCDVVPSVSALRRKVNKLWWQELGNICDRVPKSSLAIGRFNDEVEGILYVLRWQRGLMSKEKGLSLYKEGTYVLLQLSSTNTNDPALSHTLNPQDNASPDSSSVLI